MFRRLLCASLFSAFALIAGPVTLDFSAFQPGVGNVASIGNYFNGGTNGEGVGPGPSYGITFFVNEETYAIASTSSPSGNSVLSAAGSGGITMLVSGGFTGTFSGFFSGGPQGADPNYAPPIFALDNGVVVGQTNITPPGDINKWLPFSVSVNGTANQIGFLEDANGEYGDSNYFRFDSLQFSNLIGINDQPSPPTAAPEPGSLALLSVPLLLGAVTFKRKRSGK